MTNNHTVADEGLVAHLRSNIFKAAFKYENGEKENIEQEINKVIDQLNVWQSGDREKTAKRLIGSLKLFRDVNKQSAEYNEAIKMAISALESANIK